MSTLAVDVSGMTCNHCVGSVTNAVSALEGVEKVDINLDPQGMSRVTITHSSDDLVAEVAQAIASEGYTLEAVVENK